MHVQWLAGTLPYQASDPKIGQQYSQAWQPPAWGIKQLPYYHDQQALLQADETHLEGSHVGLARWQLDAGYAEEDPALDRAGEVPALDQRDLADPGCKHPKPPSAPALAHARPVACFTSCVLVCSFSASLISELPDVTQQAQQGIMQCRGYAVSHLWQALLHAEPLPS